MNATFSGHSDAEAFIAVRLWEWTAMTSSDHEVSDLHLSSRPTVANVGTDMPDDYRGNGRPGWKQLLCAWFIVLTFAMLFKITDLILANQTAPFARAIDLSRMADVDQIDEIEHWERGVPRQWTMTVPNPRAEVLMSASIK
jgi:hypothetical protein